MRDEGAKPGMGERAQPMKAGDAAAIAREGGSIRDYVEVMRPSHWVKNVIVLAAPAAGMKLTDPEAWMQAIVAFSAFCLTASATYAINDTLDREADAAHPVKRYRPVARGAIGPVRALGLAAVLFAVSVLISLSCLKLGVTAALVLYFVLTLAYSAALKQAVILDVLIIALGFVLRAWAGALAVDVPPSEWLIACVFTLCMFMGFGKRRCEVAMISSDTQAKAHRPTLPGYTPDLLNHLITVSAGIAIITFLLYTVDTSGFQAPFPKRHLFFSLPIVVYGIFRFAMVTEAGWYSGPVDIVLRDRPIQFSLLLWGTFALIVAYQVPLFGEGGLEGLVAAE